MSTVDVDSRELPALEASYGRGCLNALIFLEKALKLCINKPMIVVDRGLWYRRALDRLGLKYRYQRFGVRNSVERFFGYLKQRTKKFYNNINTWRIQSIEDYASTIAITRNLHIIIKNRGRVLPS